MSGDAASQYISGEQGSRRVRVKLPPASPSLGEATATFPCFGSTCSVFVIGDGVGSSAHDAVTWARAQLEHWHRTFTRFAPDSELSLLNEDRRQAVPVGPAMARLAELVKRAAELTNGLVDATLLREIESAGYTSDLAQPIDLREALAMAPPRAAAAPRLGSRWPELRVDRAANVVFRPHGLRLDSGGLAKGLFCDILAEKLDTHHAFAVDCGGDLRVGGRVGLARAITVASPFGNEVLHTFTAATVAAATSGIGRRSWIDGEGRPCHHLLDPSTSRPAFTGIVQVTALAARTALAEVRAKAAILSGVGCSDRWLPDGGVIVYDDGSHEVVDPAGSRSQVAPSFL
jgi:thiamine biosynthesis lipoprotein